MVSSIAKEVPEREWERVPADLSNVSSRPKSAREWLDRTAGGWAGIVDAEEQKREIYDGRLISTRTEPRL